MAPRPLFVALLLFLLSFLTFATSTAEWVVNGIPVRTATSAWDQVAVTLPSGDIIVAFASGVTGQQDVYVQKIDALGNILWTPEGVTICTAAYRQEHMQIIADGQGGAIVVWDDKRDGTSYLDIFAQRVDGQGNSLWTPDGVAVIDTSFNTKVPQIVPDGSGGAIITWTDGRGPTQWNIYGQRIDANGNRLWPSQGKAVVYSTGAAEWSVTCPDGNDGMLLAWREYRTGGVYGNDIFAQKLDGNGTALWDSAGVCICQAYYDQSSPSLVDDGSGGAIATWNDYRNTISTHIYAQRVDAAGNVLWLANGEPVCLAANSQSNPKIVTDNAGGAIIAWDDYRPGYITDVYAQRLNSFGVALWATDGIAVCTEDSSQVGVVMVADGGGGAIIGWADDRDEPYTERDIYAQQIDGNGNLGWDPSGVPVGQDPSDLGYHLAITGDGRNGAVVFWNEYRIGGNNCIYAQRIERHGYWGYPGPVISDVADVPFDQGGKVTVTWDASRLDVYDQQLITFYSVWRKLDAAKSSAWLAAGAARVTPADIKTDFQGSAVWSQVIGEKNYSWEWLANLPSHYLPSYTYTAATLFDSTSSDPALHHLMVAAQTSDPFVFWDSGPDSGSSVDNLAPGAPLNLAAHLSGPDVQLSWMASGHQDEDLLLYNVYRSNQDGFPPDQMHLIGTAGDTTYVDADPGGGVWYYRVAGVDVHENVGDPSNQAQVNSLTGADNSNPPTAFALHGNYPNPFNPLTIITYELPHSAAVSLHVYDIGGRLVRILKEDVKEPVGCQETSWDGCDGRGRSLPSGVYFYRLRAGSFAETRRMMLIR